MWYFRIPSLGLPVSCLPSFPSRRPRESSPTLMGCFVWGRSPMRVSDRLWVQINSATYVRNSPVAAQVKGAGRKGSRDHPAKFPMQVAVCGCFMSRAFCWFTEVARLAKFGWRWGMRTTPHRILPIRLPGRIAGSAKGSPPQKTDNRGCSGGRVTQFRHSSLRGLPRA